MEWTPSADHPGYMEKTITVRAVSVLILRPILSPSERAAQEKRIKSTLSQLPSMAR